DVIAVSVENKEAISTVLRKARGQGIKVLTWDADAEPDARNFFVNQATPQGIAGVLLEHTARILGGKGSFAIVTASLTAANQNEWIKHIKEGLAAKYPDLKLVDIRPSDDDRKRAFDETQTLLKVHPEVKVVMAIASPARATTSCWARPSPSRRTTSTSSTSSARLSSRDSRAQDVLREQVGEVEPDRADRESQADRSLGRVGDEEPLAHELGHDPAGG